MLKYMTERWSAITSDMKPTLKLNLSNVRSLKGTQMIKSSTCGVNGITKGMCSTSLIIYPQ